MSSFLMASLALTQFTLALDSTSAYSAYSPVTVSGVTVPPYGVQGEHAVLSCHYRSVQPVYSVRWYKNGKEFYSYLPGKLSPISVHHLPGINVDVRKSNMKQVALNPLTLASTGRYRCEVSEEGPMFATDSAYGDLLVVVVPDKGPRIVGAENNDRYAVGDKLDMNCTSEATLPPANLTWYINQQPVPLSQTVQYGVENVTNLGDQLHTSTIGLLRHVKRHDYLSQHHKQIKIKCVASIYSAYYKVVEISLARRRKGRRTRDRSSTPGTSWRRNITRPGAREQLKSPGTRKTQLNSGGFRQETSSSLLALAVLLPCTAIGWLSTNHSP